MVWVNPPNRFNYIVIARLRNVHSRRLSEFDATDFKMFNNRDAESRGNSKFQLQSPGNIQTQRLNLKVLCCQF